MVDIDSVNGRALVMLLVVGGVMATGVVAASTLTVSSGTTYEAGNGFEVTAGTQFTSSFANPFNGSNQIILNNVTFTSNGDSDLTIDQFTGTYTNISSIDTNGTDIKVDPNDKPAVNVTGGVTDLDFRDAELDGNTDFVYSASSSGTVVVRGLAGSTKYGVVDSGGSVIDNGTTTASGQATISLSSATDRSVSLITPSAPDIDAATASPTGRVSGGSQTFEVNVSDVDSSDSLTAEFYINGNLIGSDTASQNGTVSVSHTVATGGTRPWHVEVTDAYNLTTTSDSDVAQSGDQPFTIDVPASLTVRNVSNTSQLVTGASLEVTFLSDNEVVTRKDGNNDGKIDFSGLPLDERFEARISANGYHTRSIVIPSLFEQSDAYLLNNTKTTVTPRFVIDSAVSDFPERSSEIIIERPINGTNGQRFATVSSAEPGVSGLDVTLEKGQRYRLTVRGTSGATRQLGSYQATATEQVTLEIASGQFNVPDTVNSVAFDAGFTQQPAAVTATVRDENIQSATVVVTRRNDSRVILDQTTTGNLSVSTPAKNETQYIVNMTATLQSGKTVSKTQQVSSGQIATGGAIDSQWQQLLAMVLLLIVAGLFTRANAGVGAISTASIGGVFWYIGWLNGVATGLAVVVALLIGVLAYAKQKRGGVPT